MTQPNLHSPERQLIELRMEHADLNAMIDRADAQAPRAEADAEVFGDTV